MPKQNRRPPARGYGVMGHRHRPPGIDGLRTAQPILRPPPPPPSHATVGCGELGELHRVPPRPQAGTSPWERFQPQKARHPNPRQTHVARTSVRGWTGCPGEEPSRAELAPTGGFQTVGGMALFPSTNGARRHPHGGPMKRGPPYVSATPSHVTVGCGEFGEPHRIPPRPQAGTSPWERFQPRKVRHPNPRQTHVARTSVRE